MKNRSQKINTVVNIISNIGVLAVNLVVSFFLTPYIIRTIGVEANGFVNLANNFVSYAELVVTALNAMAARFIAIAYLKKDYKKANLYYNSVFWGNLIIDALLLFPALFFILKINIFINVPQNILVDVKVLFAFVFLSFFLKTGFPNWDCGTYITNRLDRISIPSMFFAILRVVFLLGLFTMFTPHVWYIGFTSCMLSMGVLAVSGYNTHVLTPKLKIRFHPPICSKAAIKELVGSGIWSSVAIAGNMLFSGIDLLICNIFLGATLMGILSLSKTLTNILVQLGESVRGAVGPEMTMAYTKNDQKTMYQSVTGTMKMTSTILPVAVGGVIVLCDRFYSLWVPTQNTKLLCSLTILSLLNQVINSGIVILYNAFTVVNKVKINAVLMLISGAVSIFVTILFIMFTDFDIYAIAGVSSVVSMIKELFFVIPISSRLLGFKWYQFYPQVIVSVVSTGMVVLIGVIVKHFILINSWETFFIAAGIVACIGLFVNMMIILNKNERKTLIKKILRRAI